MTSKLGRIAQVVALAAAMGLVFGCSSSDSGNGGGGGPKVDTGVTPDTGGTDDLGLPDTGPTPDTLRPDTAGPAKPTPGFGDLCNRSKPCKAGLVCVTTSSGATFGFCTLSCSGASDTRCAKSKPTTMDPKVNARCAFRTSRGPICGFLCQRGEPCPKGMVCGKLGTTSGVCTPGSGTTKPDAGTGSKG